MQGTAVHKIRRLFPGAQDRADGLKRALGLALLVVASWLWASPAQAAMMTHYDLRSLAFESTDIVRAERVSERKVDEYTTLVTHRVTKVLFGSLTPGALVELDYGALWLESPFEREPEGSLSKEVILFLAPGRTATDAGPPALELVSSGLRILRSGKVMRFEQQSNPGPYGPVPQGIDPFDITGDPRGEAELTFEDLEPMILKAVEQAKQAHALIDRAEAEPTPRNLELLVDVVAPNLPPDDEIPAFMRTMGSFFEDRVAEAALRVLQEKASADVLAGGVARAGPGVSLFGVLHVSNEQPFFALALNPKVGLRLRLAALAILENGWRNRKDTHIDEVVRLLNDPSPEVRAAAVALRWSQQKPPAAIENALERLLSREKDGRVLCALWNRLAPHGSEVGMEKAGAPPPYLTAAKQGLAVMLAFCAGGDGHWDFKKADLEIREHDRKGKVVRVVDLAKTVNGWSGMGAGGFTGFIDPRGLTPGDYALSLAVILDNGKGKAVSQMFELEYLRISGKLQMPILQQLPPVTTPSTAPTEPAATVTPRSGSCVCTAGVAESGAEGLWLSVAFAGLLVRRRRVRPSIS